MKKFLLSFALVAICYLAFPGLTVSAAGSLWNRAMSGSVKYNDDSDDSRYGNSFDLIISSINIDTDEWGVFAYGTSSTDLNIVIISTHSFSVSYDWRAFGSKQFSSYSGSSDVYNGLYCVPVTRGGNGYIHFMRSADISVFNGDIALLIEALKNQDPSGFVSIPGPNVDNGTFDKDLGYLVGISERSSILDVEQFNRVFKIGWGSKTSTGIDLSGSDKYEDLQVQAKIKVYGHFVSLIQEISLVEFPM